MASRYRAVAYAVVIITAAAIIRVVAPAVGEPAWAFLAGLGAYTVGLTIEHKRRESAGQR